MEDSMSNSTHHSWLVAVACVALALPASAAQARTQSSSNHQSSINNQQSFDRYQVILARMPFGDEAAAAAAAEAARTAANGPPPDSFTKTLKLSAITRNHFNGKVQVGLTDVAIKKSYFLYEGDSEDGIELIKADYENEKALLKKGAEQAWLDMNSAPVIVVATPVPTSRSFRGAPAGARRVALSQPEAPQKPQLTGEALQKHLKEYQMELIRAKGEKGPPLPMELTPEMDQQLVDEGVLPPAE